jgi:cobaltochelatase CobS
MANAETLAQFDAAGSAIRASIVRVALGIRHGDVMQCTKPSQREALIAGDKSLLIKAETGMPFYETRGTDSTTPAPFDINEIIDRVNERIDTAVETAVALAVATLPKGGQADSGTRIVLPSGKVNVIKGKQHEMFPELLDLLALRIPVFLKGPAGSGKTTAGENVAKALDLPFFCQSMGPQTSQSQLLGYPTAGTGEYVPGLLYEPYKNGGVVLLDEIDNANPGVVTTLNSATSNGYCSFPYSASPETGGMIKRHPDCVFIAAGNTFGKGADALYVGRQQLDGASLNRFVSVEWNYDEKLERSFITDGYSGHALATTLDAWVTRVQTLRDIVSRLKLRIIISPRQTLFGAALIASGKKTMRQAEDRVIWTSVGADDKAKVLANGY